MLYEVITPAAWPSLVAMRLVSREHSATFMMQTAAAAIRKPSYPTRCMTHAPSSGPMKLPICTESSMRLEFTALRNNFV